MKAATFASAHAQQLDPVLDKEHPGMKAEAFAPRTPLTAPVTTSSTTPQ